MFVSDNDVPFNTTNKQSCFPTLTCGPAHAVNPFGLSMCRKSQGFATCVGNLKDRERIGNVPEIPVLRGGASEVGHRVGGFVTCCFPPRPATNIAIKLPAQFTLVAFV